MSTVELTENVLAGNLVEGRQEFDQILATKIKSKMDEAKVKVAKKMCSDNGDDNDADDNESGSDNDSSSSND